MVQNDLFEMYIGVKKLWFEIMAGGYLLGKTFPIIKRV
jgi:hypothetical protein